MRSPVNNPRLTVNLAVPPMNVADGFGGSDGCVGAGVPVPVMELLPYPPILG